MPYLTDDNVNYLLKMKSDTSVFATLALGRYFNFATETSRGDPFLIQASVSGNIVAGNRARALKKGRDANKRTIPLADEDMNKAKACEEMILYERPLSGSQKSSLQIASPTSTGDKKAAALQQ